MLYDLQMMVETVFNLDKKNKTIKDVSEVGRFGIRVRRNLFGQVQRIPEYDKYLNELLQETDPGHPDYENLSRAAGKVRHMVKEREDELGNMDNQRRIERVQDKFPHDDLQLRDLDLQRRQLASRRKSAPGAVLFKTLSKSRSTNNILSHSHSTMGKKDMEFSRPSRQNNNFNRQYLMEGIVEFSRGLQTQDRYLFLFSDLLLVAKQKSNTTFKLKHRIRVCELWIAHCIDDITELTRPVEKSFVIGWPTTNYVATFKSVELKDTWLNKFSEQIQEERSKLIPKTLMLDVLHKESDKTCQVEVETVTNAVDIIKSCIEQLNVANSEVKDYQLWVRLGPDEAPYPLCGHELPYAIKVNHIRDYAKRTDDNLTQLEIQRIMEEMENNNRKYEFFLKHKKSQKRHSIDESTKAKNKKKSPLINIFRRNRDDKKPQGKLFGHKLSDITSPENLIAKPVKDLMTILFREGPYTVGILRKSCNAKMCKELKQRLDDGEDCLNSEEWPPLVIGSLLKDYLRSIPQSLLMEELFDDWMAANNAADPVEKNNKLRDTLTKLPDPHYELVRHLLCVLYHIERKSSENKMTAFNLSVCIAPSLLWPKGNCDPLATPPALFQYMIENFAQLFGEDSINLFGDSVEQKMRQDSSTDSDSMHSVLSSHGNYRRDDSSLDSLDREILYTGDMDRSPQVLKSNHFSPSNLSGDSGLISDQFYDDDGNGNDYGRGYLRSSSYSHQEIMHDDLDPGSHSMDNRYYQYDPQNPVPPPRRPRRKGSDHSGSPNMEFDRKPSRYTSESNFNIPPRYNKRYNQNALDKFKRRSTESLKSVEESSEADSEMNMASYRRPDIGTLIKSASGAHLYFEEPQLLEFDDLNSIQNHRHLYKQSSEGAMPMSPQSKYSLNSSRDSVLSDSSGSFLNRQNSPDPLSSSAETPDHEDRGMSDWVNQQSKHTAYTAQKQRRISQDDIEVGVKVDKKPMTKIDYLVSPKTSPKVRRRSPAPLSVRRSFPMHMEILPKGSGSNTSKEAEDIIKSPKLTVTYCSQDSLDKREFETPQKEKMTSPQLDLYNNNSQQAMKQLNIYSTGLQGTSPPPRVLLQGLNSQSQTPRRENTPVKGNHEILTQKRRNSFDSAQISERQQKYLMEESSVSSEEDGDTSDSDVVVTRVTTIVNLPVSYPIQQKVLNDNKTSGSSSLSRSSSCHSEDNTSSRPENPPGYAEAVHRSLLLKQGLSPDQPSDSEVEEVKQASMKAKQLYEQSMRQYQEQSVRYSLPSQAFEQTLNAHEEHAAEDEEETSSDSSDEETPKIRARKLYEESVKRYMAERSSESPLVKSQSIENKHISLSNTKGGGSGLLAPPSSGLHRSCSDIQDKKQSRSVSPANRSSGGSSRDSTPTKRPDQPPPYNDPPPYRVERSESSPRNSSRHTFPRAAETSTTQSFTPKAQTENCSYVNRTESSTENAQLVSVPKRRDNVLVSNRARNSVNSNISKSTDFTVRSAQSEIGKYRSPAVRGRNVTDSRSSRSMTPNSMNSQSESVFRPRASSLEPTQPHGDATSVRASSQGLSSYRDPETTSVNQSKMKVDTQTGSKKVIRSSSAAQKDLPWSVKRLSNIFDANKQTEAGNNSQSNMAASSNISTRNPPMYTPPPALQRYNDTTRSSTSSSSSYGSSNAGHTRTSAKSYNKYGPQSQDSFSSTDDSDCSCRYSLNCRRDNSSLEDLADVSFTDITYV